MSMIYLLNYWLPPVLWMVFLFPLTNDALSARSTADTIVPLIEPIIRLFLPGASQATIHTIHILIRKLFHLFNYAFLAFLLWRAFQGKNKDWCWKRIWYSCVISVGYGALDEFLQTMTATRTGSFSDWMIDSIGVLFFLGVVTLIRQNHEGTLSEKTI